MRSIRPIEVIKVEELHHQAAPCIPTTQQESHLCSQVLAELAAQDPARPPHTLERWFH